LKALANQTFASDEVIVVDVRSQDLSSATLLALGEQYTDYQVFIVEGDLRARVLDYASLIAQQAGLDIEPVITGVYRFGNTRLEFFDVGK
jgi:glycosyltransferase involved in cell wall biosynthesis